MMGFLIVLAQDIEFKEWKEVTWKFPEIDIYTFIWIAIFFALMGLAFYIANYVKGAQKRAHERWRILKGSLRKFHPTIHEYEILQHFFERLSFDDKMSHKLFVDPGFTLPRLLDFLEKFPEEDYIHKIELLTKLYPEDYQKDEIKNISDIRPAEFCDLVFSNQKALAYVKRFEEGQISLKIFPLYYLHELRYPNVKLEFFRKGRGKYSLKGTFYNSRKGDMFFKPTGTFEFTELPFGVQPNGEVYEEEQNYDSISPDLRDCLEKILDYAEIGITQKRIFLENMDVFRNLKDKFSNIEAARVVRSNIAELFFPIYETVYKKSFNDKNKSKFIANFLEYCMMDEKLLYPSQILELEALPYDKKNPDLKTYGMREWLERVYNLIEEPSVNELGQTFHDANKLKRIKGFISEEEEKNYSNSSDRRLSFEILNAFKAVQKLCFGTPSVYFPILHKEMITKPLNKSMVTPEKIREGIGQVLEIDYSAFHRETYYTNEVKDIQKEAIMTQVIPEFIITPTYGSRCVMWQEVASHKRNTAGRFFVPMFTAENFFLMLLRSVGNFRWELAKTIQGRFWSDITTPSLTSEYYDYLAYYRKNQNLSMETKEKVRQQIIKYRKSIRDIFASDYMSWILFESRGVPRLNRVTRSIFYRYCPFPKNTRDVLSKQPIYSDIGNKFNNLRLKKIEELENHYFNLKKNKGFLPQELQENLRFYKDL